MKKKFDIVEKCEKCDLKECVECEHTWSDMQEIKKYIEELEKKLDKK